MALLVEGYNHRIGKNIGLPTRYFFPWILQLTPLYIKDNNSYVLKANWKISMPNIIYYSRPIHRCPQNTRGTCHVSTNMSWSQWTLKSKKSNFQLLRIWDFTNIHSRGQKHWEYVESVIEQFKKLGFSFRTAVSDNQGVTDIFIIHLRKKIYSDISRFLLIVKWVSLRDWNGHFFPQSKITKWFVDEGVPFQQNTTRN